MKRKNNDINSNRPAQESSASKTEITSKSRRKFLGHVTAATVASGIAGLPETRTAEAAVNETLSETGTARVEKAYETRVQAALFQKIRPLPDHPNNGDEERYPNKIGNYSKGLPHNQLGEVDLNAYNALTEAVKSGNPDDFEQIPMGGNTLLKNPQAGLTYEMAGPDPGHVFMPPAPAFASAEIAGEIAENYWMALCRDVNFLEYDTNPLTIAAAQDLSNFSDFRGPKFRADLSQVVRGGQSGLSSEGAELVESQSHRQLPVRGAAIDQQSIGSAPFRRQAAGRVRPSTLFRGLTPGDLAGPYISQFLWKDISYGVQTISQKMRTTAANRDYLTNYSDWLFAQNSRGHQNLAGEYDPTPRYIRNGRDLGEWVHIDVLFQAYFNAALLLLGMGARVDANNPYEQSKTQCGFGTFGPPHIQSMVCAVATNALRAVWYQKWFVHRRLRPEVFAGRIHNHLTGAAQYPIHSDILNSAAVQEVNRRRSSYLLPMAFVEGSPTHPAYGAGHATVAGACVTVLKAWFDESWTIPDPVVVSADGLSLVPYTGPALTVGGELNKLASNVAFGRNFAGVHWRTDAVESLKFGEAVTIGLLTDLKGCYNENFAGFSLTRFDGTRITI